MAKFGAAGNARAPRALRRKPQPAGGAEAIPIEALIARYGVLAIGIGAGIEGEAVVISGGVLARKGLLPFWGVAAAAAVGSLVVDQFWFFAGRFFRERPWVRRLTRKPAFAKALALLERHSTLFILAFRFIYGIRTASPIAIGTSRVPARRFMLLNAVAAAIWGPAIAGIGYGLGVAIERWLHRLHAPLVIALSLAAAAAGGLLLWRRARAKQRPPDGT